MILIRFRSGSNETTNEQLVGLIVLFNSKLGSAVSVLPVRWQLMQAAQQWWGRRAAL